MATLGYRPFVGSEALAAGLVNEHRLRRDFSSLLPDVYVRSNVELTLELRATAAWLWSHRQGVIAGLTAAGLHGAKWVDDRLSIELVWSNARRPRGVRVSDYRLATEDITAFGLMRATTPARAAFDIGRRGRLDGAVARLDALGNATRFTAEDVIVLRTRHCGVRGLRQLDEALESYDPGAASPRETWLRLLLIRAGLPRPRTRISLVGRSGRQYYVDMGWEDATVAVEYNGDQHRVDRTQSVKDIRRLEELSELGWTVVRVVAENHDKDIIDRVHRARESRLQ